MNKQQFLNNFINSPKPKDTTSAIPFLAKHLEIARKNNITFSKEEINEIQTQMLKDAANMYFENNPDNRCVSIDTLKNEGYLNKDYKEVTNETNNIQSIDKDGNVLYNNITWVDGRAEEQAQKIMNRLGGKKLFTMVAGTPTMGKDCTPKIIWLKEKKNSSMI